MITTKELRDIVAQAYNGLITDAELLLKLQLPPEVVPRVIAWQKLPLAAFDKIDLGDLFGSDDPRDAPISGPACDDAADDSDDAGAPRHFFARPSLRSVNVAGTPFGVKLTERLGYGINGDWQIVINGRTETKADVRLGTHNRDKWFCTAVQQWLAHRNAATFKPDGALSSVAITAQNFFAFFDSPVIDDLWPQPGQTVYLTYRNTDMINVNGVLCKPTPPVPVAKMKKVKPGTPIGGGPIKAQALEPAQSKTKKVKPDVAGSSVKPKRTASAKKIPDDLGR